MQYAPASHGAVVLAVLPLLTAMAGAAGGGRAPVPRVLGLRNGGNRHVLIYSLLAGGAPAICTGPICCSPLPPSAAAMAYALGGEMARRIGGWEVISWALVFSAPVMLVLVLLSGRSTGPPAPRPGPASSMCRCSACSSASSPGTRAWRWAASPRSGKSSCCSPSWRLPPPPPCSASASGGSRSVCRAGGRHRGPGMAHAGRAARLILEQLPRRRRSCVRGWRMRHRSDGEAHPWCGYRVQTARAVLGLALACGPASAQSAEDAFGLWLNPENGSNIEFYKCGGEGLCAKVTKVTDGQKTDDKNPDPAKRSQPIVGLVIMENAKKSGANMVGHALQPRERQELFGHHHRQEQGCSGPVGLRRRRALQDGDLDPHQVTGRRVTPRRAFGRPASRSSRSRRQALGSSRPATRWTSTVVCRTA